LHYQLFVSGQRKNIVNRRISVLYAYFYITFSKGGKDMKKLGIVLVVALFSLIAFGQDGELSLADRVGALEGSVGSLQQDIEGLSEIISGLAGQIGDTDYLLRKQISDLSKSIDQSLAGTNAKIDSLTKNTEDDLDILSNRLDLLEEYTNMIYDSLGTKVAVEDFDVAMAGLDERLGELETNILNIQGTVNDGLPALRDLIYELSANIASVEERLTSYVEVSSDSAKAAAIEEVLAEVNPMLDDIKVTLDIHDGDILKIYETLGNLSDELANLNDMVSELQSVSENLQALSLKVDMHDQDIVNLYDNLSTKADAEKVDALETTVEENYSTLSDKVSLLEDYSNMIYDTVNTKAAQEDVVQLQQTVEDNTAKINQLEKSLKEANEKVQQAQLIGIIGIVAGVIAGIVGAMLP